MDQGFSLTEVLVSLVLMTGASLALFKQQWQISQLFNQINIRASALSNLDNAAEQLHAGHKQVDIDSPFKLHIKQTSAHAETLDASSTYPTKDADQQIINLRITWGLRSRSCCVLVRQLLVDLSDE